MTVADADSTTDAINEISHLAQYDVMQRVVVGTVSRVQFDRMVREFDAARTVFACVLPVPPLNNTAPMRVTITSCMANPVGTSEMTARALTDLVSLHEFTTGKCKITYQDSNVVRLYPLDLVERLRN